MTWEEFTQRFDQAVDNIDGQAHADLLIGIANGALATLRRRVQETGVDSTGKPYRLYSKSYQEEKRKAGKYSGHVDFTLSGRMWNNTKIISPNDEIFSGTVRIAPETSDNYELMRKNTERRGKILAVTDKEKQDIINEYRAGLIEIFQNSI